MSPYTGDYSRSPLPYGAGTTRGMTQRHYQALADTLRRVRNDSALTPDEVATVDVVTHAIAARLALGNPRFRAQTFLNAVQDVARHAPGQAPGASYGDSPIGRAVRATMRQDGAR